jgi:hypothetical protein
MPERKSNSPKPPPIVSTPPHANPLANRPPHLKLPPGSSRRKSRRWIGYLIAVLGLAGFIGIITAAVALKLEGLAARYAAQGSFLFMGLAFWIGTIIVAVEKGYHVLVGILLGAISPLGLLILTLMPDLAARNAALNESRQIVGQIQRTPDFPGE